MKALLVIVFTIICSKAFSCEGLVCLKNRVIFDQSIGTVIDISKNGKVKVRLEDSNKEIIKNSRELGVALKCSNRICKGNRVQFNDSVGKVIEIFSNRSVVIELDNTKEIVFKDELELGLETDCSDHLCRNDEVYVGKKLARVVEVFDNNKLKISLGKDKDFIFKSEEEVNLK